MNLGQSSQTLEFFRRFGASWEHSATRRATRSALSFWDRLVSGSVFIFWVTGSDLPKRIENRPSVFGKDIQKCWTAFISWVIRSFVSSKTKEQSPILKTINEIGSFFNESLFCAIGWIGCAFFPAFGILRLVFIGSSTFLIIVIVAGFVLSVFLVLTHVRLDGILSTSRLLKVLDDIDE